MSIQVLRDGLVTQRRDQRDDLLRRRSSRLRVLNAVTAALTQHVGLPHALQSNFENTPLTSDENALLDVNDLSKGRYYSDASFPITLDSVRKALLGSATSPKNATKSLAPSAEQSAHNAPALGLGVTEQPQAHSFTAPQLSQTDIAKKGGVDTLTQSHAQTSQQQQDPTQQKDTISPSASSGVTPGATEQPVKPSTETSIREPVVPLQAHATAEPQTSTGNASLPELAESVEDADKGRDAPPAAEKTGQSTTTQDAHPVEAQVVAMQSTKAGQAEGSVAPLSHGSSPSVSQGVPAVQPTPVDRPQRMQTRVASGAIRQKSVSEIMQESPKSMMRKKTPSLLQESSSMSSSNQTPSRQHQRHQASMPAPPLPPPPPLPPAQSDISSSIDSYDLSVVLPLLNNDGYAALKGSAEDPDKDYLEPLYRIQAQDPPNGRSLAELLHKASKSVTTSDQLVSYKERQDHRILKRIYGLQYANHWSLRQMQLAVEVPAPKTHWDYVMDEVKWMRTDFRQERKEKKQLAKFFAERCAEWVISDTEARSRLQVRVQKPQPLQTTFEPANAPQSPATTHAGNGEPKDVMDEDPLPDLEPSSKDDASSPIADNDEPNTPQFTVIPEAIFGALNMSKSSAHLLNTDDFAQAIEELPLYTPFGAGAESKEMGPRAPVDIVPSVSKFSSGKILTRSGGVPRKRSRYDYSEDDHNDLPESKRQRADDESEAVLPPELPDVALFDPEHKQIKDRLRASNTFRPPSEFPMPPEKFYEWRLASKWTWDDDQKLKRLAKEYSFNWSLIANSMALPSGFHGAPDRRTPWECFERWVELEALPNDLRKTVYFRTWAQRLESAARHLEVRFQAQMQIHAQNPTSAVAPFKRRTMPTSVERRPNSRYLHLVDAMRKLARKREQQQHKQAEAQKAASMRKQHEPIQSKNPIHTPQEFSKLRAERDAQIAARNERMRETMIAQQRAAQMQRAGQQPNQQAAMIAAQQQRQGNPQMQQAQNAQAKALGQMQNAIANQSQHHSAMNLQNRNGQMGAPQMGMQNSVPQAQMQANIRPNSTGTAQMTQEQMQRLAMQAQMKGNQLQNQQQQLKQYQQQMLSPSGNGMMSGQVNNNHAAMMAAMQNNQGNMQQKINMNGNSSMSSHMPPPSSSQPKQLSSGHVPAINQIKHSLQASNPQATPQQIDQMANEQMKRHIQAAQARQNAVSAATGNYGNINKGNVNAHYDHNQMNFQQNSNTGNNHGQQSNHNAQTAMGNYNNNHTPLPSTSNNNNQQQQQYSQLMRQRLIAQQQQIQNQNLGANSSPRMQQASPVNMHVSPIMQQAMPHNMTNGSNTAMGMNINVNSSGGSNNTTPAPQQSQQQRPPSRNATPQMARIPSSGSMVSPGMQQQGSPRPQMVKQG